MSWLSEIVWALWIAFGLAWEIFTVLMEKRHKQFEPLTRIYRDKLMRMSKFGIVFRLTFIAAAGWLCLHWLVPLSW